VKKRRGVSTGTVKFSIPTVVFPRYVIFVNSSGPVVRIGDIVVENTSVD
jgi:hypothetical protein